MHLDKTSHIQPTWSPRDWLSPRRRSWAYGRLGRKELAAADQLVIADLGADVSDEQRAESAALWARMRKKMNASLVQTVRSPSACSLAAYLLTWS